MRFCVENAFFSLKEIDVGMAADLGVFPRLSKLIGDGWVRYMAFTGERILA